MVNLAGMLATVPTGLWEKIIFAFNGAVGNYALAIVLITLCIKIVMLPLDIFNKRSTAKMTEVQEKLAPKMAEIKKKYPDQQMQNQKMQELYKKEGFNPMGSCVTMLVVMGLSMAIFFTLFGGLNNMAQYKVVTQYEELQKTYVTTGMVLSDEAYDKLTQAEIDGHIITISKGEGVVSVELANEAVEYKYSQVKESFLWVKNVWLADSPMAKAVPSFASFAQLAKWELPQDKESQEYKDKEAAFNAIMGNLEEGKQVNGFFILSILAGVSTFLSQYLVTRAKKKEQKKNFYTQNAGQTDQQKAQAGSGKMMQILFPALMIVFTLTSNAVFALYVVVGQVFSLATTPLVNKIVKKLDKRKKA
ncbi:MAG: YidC/Oxa1 family membrane protein insertase [Clostridiales bacterium]|nr:YidC/Oxa1 family membrane protein insertase [Clostridiales bacterium]